MQVTTLITMFAKLEEMIKRFGKSNFKQMMQDPASAAGSRMSQQQLGQLTKMINPAVLKQMGGMGGLQNIMRQMQGGGAPGGPASAGGAGLPGLGVGGPGGLDFGAMMKTMKNMQKGRK
uniref:Signal recognition particle 54 kDa protein n=1 Tax=Lygus hesperus TaxID=30085 RepID=A0A0A9WZ75_LYGHE